MTLDFNAVDPTVVPHFKGSTSETHASPPLPTAWAVSTSSDLARRVLHRPAYPHWQL